MESGERKAESGKWEVESGERRVGSGEWNAKKSRFRAGMNLLAGGGIFYGIQFFTLKSCNEIVVF